jgi:hypothetical protein
MSNNNEDDDYNDDYYEVEQEEPEPVRAESPDDEQQAQKVNGKLEALQSELDSAKIALHISTVKNTELSEQKDRLEQENGKLRGSGASSSGTGKTDKEIALLRKANDQLKEQLDTALSLGSSSQDCPLDLRKAFLKFCKVNNIFPDLKEKALNVEMCIKILKSQKPSMALGSSLDGGGSQVSLMSSAESATGTRIRQHEGSVAGAPPSSAHDVQALRAKVIHMNERIRIEKEHKFRAEGELQQATKKIDMMGAHMEKLLVHLKHEGAHKLRIAEQFRVAERECAAANEKCDYISRKSAAKDRLILELREGSKVLEDQLRLMDEKYMELRTKLDYARELGVKKIKKAEKIASDLRIKFALTNGSAILDAIPLPTENSYGSWNGGGGMMMSPMDHNNGGNNGGYPPSLQIGFSDNRNYSPSPGGGNNNMVGGRAAVPRGILKSSSMSMTSSVGSINKEPTMDGVLEKIRVQEGRKQEWTEKKLKNLVDKGKH